MIFKPLIAGVVYLLEEPLLRLIIPARASILTPFFLSVRISVATKTNAEVAELADAADSKSAGLNTRVGSTPTFGTITFYYLVKLGFWNFMRAFANQLLIKIFLEVFET